jgi:BirA family biotin operon repressor/biotin-[acetyl-CoA-carboxylase] ligase
MRASFDTGQVDAALAGTPLARQVHHVASTGSTNALALEAAQAGVATGVWLADEQTAGRGRSGHTWHSAAGDGLYVSVLLRPRLFGADALKLSLAAGLAAKHVVVEAGGIPAAQVDLRWPNDLMITGLDAILIPLLRELVRQVDLVEAEAADIPTGEAPLALRFERASNWVRGLAVDVAEGDGYTGVTDGLNAHGLLRVRLPDGSTRTVRHGGVRRVGQNQGG